MELKTIPLKQIKANKSQPRNSFDKEAIKELAESILSNGLVNPIIVRQENKNNYVIVAGERRFKAHQVAKLNKIDAFVREYKNDMEWMVESLIENLQREDLTSIERENYVYKIWETGLFKTKNDLARKLGYRVDKDGHSFISDLILAKEERDSLEKAGVRTHDINTEIIKKAKTLDPDSKKEIYKKLGNKEIIPQRAKELIPVLKKSQEEVRKALLNEEIDTSQAERINKLKTPEARKQAIKQHKDIKELDEDVEEDVEREEERKEMAEKLIDKKALAKQLVQAGNWIKSFRNRVTEANNKNKEAIKSLLLATKFIPVMDSSQKTKLDGELDRFIDKLEEGLQLAEQIQNKI